MSRASPWMSSPVQWGPMTVVLEHIGRGSVGDVYRRTRPLRARIRSSHSKILRSRQPARRAAAHAQSPRRALLRARVSHPNVVTVYGAERLDGQVGVWMRASSTARFGWRKSFEQRVVHVNPQAVAGIGVDLCAALEAVHRCRRRAPQRQDGKHHARCRWQSGPWRLRRRERRVGIPGGDDQQCCPARHCLSGAERVIAKHPPSPQKRHLQPRRGAVPSAHTDRFR